MTTLKLHYAPRVGPAYPRGARVAATWFAWLLDGMATLLRRRSGAPADRAARTAAEEAQEVREMAWQIRASDPRFAEDLLAAADRHERLHGA